MNKKRSEDSKEVVIGFFNPLAAPFLRHNETNKSREVEEEGEEEEEEKDVETGDYNAEPRSFEELSEDEKKEYMRYLQQEYDDLEEEDTKENQELYEELRMKDQQEEIAYNVDRKKELLLKITMDCMKKCCIFKTHPYVGKVNLFRKEESCIKSCARKSFAMLSVVYGMDEDGEISLSQMLLREHGMDEDDL